MTDLERAVAFVFRRKGEAAMSKVAFKGAVSLDLRWFGHADAKRLYEKAVEHGLLLEQGDEVRPGFDVTAVDIPLNFRPGYELLDAGPTPPPARAAAPPPRAPPRLADEVIAATAASTGETPSVIESAVADEMARSAGLFSREVAALSVARARGLDVSEWVTRARAALAR